MKENKLWALPTNEENLMLQLKFNHFFSTPDHVLIISDHMPDNAIEVTPELEFLLDSEDWLWIWKEHAALAQEEEIRYRTELDDYLRKFEERFLNELAKRKEGLKLGNIANGASSAP